MGSTHNWSLFCMTESVQLTNSQYWMNVHNWSLICMHMESVQLT